MKGIAMKKTKKTKTCDLLIPQLEKISALNGELFSIAEAMRNSGIEVRESQWTGDLGLLRDFSNGCMALAREAADAALQARHLGHAAQMQRQIRKMDAQQKGKR